MENNVFDFKISDSVLNKLRCQNDPLAIIGLLEIEKRNLNDKIPNKPLGKCLKKYNKKIDDLQRQKTIDNDKRIKANRKKEELIAERQRDLEIQQRRKKIELKKHIKNKEITSKKLLAERENLKLSAKHNNETKRYFDTVEHQNEILAEKQLLIDKCFRNRESDEPDDGKELFKSYEEDTIDEPLEKMEEEECFIDSDQSRIQEMYKQKDLGMLNTYLERIAKLKKNFSSCEAGRNFLIKTAPLWDSLTQCIYRKSLIQEDMAKKSDNAILESNRELLEQTKKAETKRMRGLCVVDTSFLEHLITDLGYEISDDEVYHALTEARRLLDHSATALELIELVKLIIQYDINVRENVSYVFDGLCRRAVFEYTKKRMSYHMLGHSKNVINRLQLLNDINLIPKRLLTSKNSEKQVEPIVLEFLSNDAKYGHLTAGEKTIPVDGMYPSGAETKMREFIEAMVSDGDLDASSDMVDGENLRKHQVYELPGKRLLEIHVDAQVGRLMVYVHKQLASSLSRISKLNNSTCGFALTRDTYNILARKITKMVFCMGGSYEEKLYVLEVVIKKIAFEIVKRSPKVLYEDKNKKKANVEDTKIDISFYSKRLDTFLASRKSIK